MQRREGGGEREGEKKEVEGKGEGREEEWEKWTCRTDWRGLRGKDSPGGPDRRLLRALSGPACALRGRSGLSGASPRAEQSGIFDHSLGGPLSLLPRLLNARLLNL